MRRALAGIALLALLGVGVWVLLTREGTLAPFRRTGTHLLLVSIDTLRADALGSYGYPKAQTPRLDALGARGLRFEQATTVAPLTLPAHSSLLTGTFPATHGVRDNGGFYLGVYWSLFIDTLGDQAASFATTGPIAIGDSGMIAQVQGNGLTVTAGVGEFKGASGLFNIVQATGNNMTIISNLTVNIALVTVRNQGAIPKLSGFTPW